MKTSLILLFLSLTGIAHAQQRLELLETNVAPVNIQPYTDSYLWVKSWWLTNGMFVPVEKGGNALAAKSKLNRAGVDSLGRLFRENLPPQLIRFGKLKPRLVHIKNSKVPHYIVSTIFEFKNDTIQPLYQFKVVFDNVRHNNMADVMDIQLIHANKIKPIDKKFATDIYNRKSTPIEMDIQGPGVSN